VKTQYQMIAMPQIQAMLSRITNIIDEKEKKERQRHIWAQATHRLDLLLLFLFNFLHIIATVVIFHIGYSKVVNVDIIGTES
jgi:hypothetical protein